MKPTYDYGCCGNLKDGEEVSPPLVTSQRDFDHTTRVLLDTGLSKAKNRGLILNISVLSACWDCSLSLFDLSVVITQQSSDFAPADSLVLIHI